MPKHDSHRECFVSIETNHCRKYLASLPAAETVGSDSEHSVAQLQAARRCTCGRFCSAYLDCSIFLGQLQKIKFKLKGWKTSQRAGCLFLPAQFDNQDHSCLFFNIIYNILQKHIFILISKQLKCPSMSVQMPWAEKLMWVLTFESQSSDFSWEKLQRHSSEY